MVSLHRSKCPRQLMPWVLVIILLTCTLLPASAAAPRIEAGSTGSDGSIYGWQSTFVADIASRQGHSAIWTGTEMIIWGGYTSNGVLNTGARYNPATGAWKAISTVGAPPAQAYHTAVWTGNEMIVWGGFVTTVLTTGGRYNPATDTWTSISPINAPATRYYHTAVWTGKEMIIWGGYVIGENTIYFNDGGRYNPATNTWAAISTDGAPTGRDWHTAVWTGEKMIIWGGQGKIDGILTSLNTGGLYSPADNRWTPVSTDSAPAKRVKHTAVFWTNGDDRTEMIVWGGCGSGDQSFTCLKTGGHYDIKNNSWTVTTMDGAPDGRQEHTAVLAGTEMLIWGGKGILILSAAGAGGRYNLEDRTWKLISDNGAPTPRRDHTAVWSGTELIIWGGTGISEGYIPLSTGGRYNPTSDTWTAIDLANAPAARMGYSAVWTGNEMIIWGGSYRISAINTGERYNPTTNTWAAMNSVNAPEGRSYHTAVWTGTEMIVWGGSPGSFTTVNMDMGGRYNPVSDTWNPIPISTDGAPQTRPNHTAVWTGTEMIIWGGMGADNSVGLYNPQSNTWELVAALGAPDARYYHTAVWTGTEMLIWGGKDSSGSINTGGRFNPETKTWQPISTDNAPEARYDHSAIWTGSKMIVWGGMRNMEDGTFFNTGGSYDPATDQWETLSLSNAPTARAGHTAVWTGDSDANTPICHGADAPANGADASVASAVMVIWGGGSSTGTFNTGGCYNPTTNTWSATSTVNAPAARSGHTAVWTGGTSARAEMIVWGGNGENLLNTGGRYMVTYPVFMPMISLKHN